MITKAAFSTGLGRLAVAARQTLDVPTLTVYHEAMVEEVEPDSWDSFTRTAAKDGEFKDWAGAVCIPKLHELREAYARTLVLPFKRPPLLQESPADYGTYLEAVMANPKRPGEGAIAYIVRIAETVAEDRLPAAAKPMPRVSREPGEDG